MTYEPPMSCSAKDWRAWCDDQTCDWQECGINENEACRAVSAHAAGSGHHCRAQVDLDLERQLAEDLAGYIHTNPQGRPVTPAGAGLIPAQKDH